MKGLKFLVFVALIISGCAFYGGCQTKPQDVATTLKPCQELLDKDDLIAANDCYGKAIIKYPQNAVEISKNGEDVFFKKCVEFKNKKNYEKSIICFESVSELMPNSANVQFNLADSYYEYQKEKKYKDFELLNRAEEAIKKGLEINPKDAGAYSLYGEILKDKGNIQESLTQHLKAVEIKSDASVLWVKLAFVQEMSNKNGEAIKSYQQALKIDSSYTVALFFLGKLYEKLGRIDEAIETIEKQNKIEAPNEETLQKLKELKEKRDFEKPKKSKAKTIGN